MREKANEAGATHCQVLAKWAQGGRGSMELADSVIDTRAPLRASEERAESPGEIKGVSIFEADSCGALLIAMSRWALALSTR